MDEKHFNQPVLREAKFYTPSNILKAKVGSGGIDERILDRAQMVIEAATADFTPVADQYINALSEGITAARKNLQTTKNQTCDIDTFIGGLIMPAAQLKANGGMFGFQQVTRISQNLVDFLEVIKEINLDTLDIVDAYLNAIKAIVAGKASGEHVKFANTLVTELSAACKRYFDKNS